MVHFQGTDYRSHTSCISEAQKYQGKLYKETPTKSPATKTSSTPVIVAPPVIQISTAADETSVPVTNSGNDKKRKRSTPTSPVPRAVEPDTDISGKKKDALSVDVDMHNGTSSHSHSGLSAGISGMLVQTADDLDETEVQTFVRCATEKAKGSKGTTLYKVLKQYDGQRGRRGRASDGDHKQLWKSLRLTCSSDGAISLQAIES